MNSEHTTIYRATIYRAVALLLFVSTTSVVLIGIPGYFSHDELQIIDSLATSNSTGGVLSFDAMRNAPFYRPWGYETFRALMMAGGATYPIVPHGALVLMHGLVCVAVFYLVRELDNERRALASAGLFAISPLAAFAVGWVAGIYDVLVTGFMVVALLAGIRLVRGGNFGWWAIFLLAAVGAAGSKETWVVLPLVLALVGFTGTVESRTRAAVVTVVSGVLVVSYLVIRYPGLSRLAEGGAGGYGVAVGDNILRNLFAYVAFPFYPKAEEITGISDRSSVGIGLSILAIVSLLVVARSASGRRWRLVVFCAALWLAYLIPVLPIGKYETQYMYGASIPFAYLLAVIVCSEVKWAKALGFVAVGVLTWHTAVVQLNMYETGRCQSRLLTSLDTLFASHGSGRSESTAQLGVVAEEGAWWWVLARALHNSQGANDSRRFARFSEHRDDADMVFTRSCAVLLKDVPHGILHSRASPFP